MQSAVIEDLCQVIGYAATRTVLAWFAGRQLYVPAVAKRGHPLCSLLGGRAFGALVDRYASDQLKIPTESHESDYRRMRYAAESLARGVTVEALAGELGVSPRRVQALRAHLTEKGWLDYAAGRRAAPRLISENLGTGEGFAEPPPPSRRPRPA